MCSGVSGGVPLVALTGPPVSFPARPTSFPARPTSFPARPTSFPARPTSFPARPTWLPTQPGLFLSRAGRAVARLLFARAVLAALLPADIAPVSALGLMGLLGESLNLFHLLAALLVLSMAVDYG